MIREKKLKMNRPLFFGCVGDAGHYVYDKDGHVKQTDYNDHARFLNYHDNKLISSPKHGVISFHHNHGFVVLAMVDYSVDTRPGSNAMFLIPGEHSNEEAVEMAKNAFPEIWNRIKPRVTDDRMV